MLEGVHELVRRALAQALRKIRSQATRRCQLSIRLKRFLEQPGFVVLSIKIHRRLRLTTSIAYQEPMAHIIIVYLWQCFSSFT